MTINHPTPAPKGATFRICDRVAQSSGSRVVPGAEFVVEDYWDVVYGKSWRDSEANPAALAYAFHAGFNALPDDDEVVYGKIGGAGHLVHVSELEGWPVAEKGGEAAVSSAPAPKEFHIPPKTLKAASYLDGTYIGTHEANVDGSWCPITRIWHGPDVVSIQCGRHRMGHKVDPDDRLQVRWAEDDLESVEENQ